MRLCRQSARISPRRRLCSIALALLISSLPSMVLGQPRSNSLILGAANPNSIPSSTIAPALVAPEIAENEDAAPGQSIPRVAQAPPPAVAPVEILPETNAFIPIDPTQLPPTAHSHSGCSCASCRGGAASEPPPGFGPKGGWFPGDCPKPVLSEGWCRRPYYFDGFIGAISGNELVDDQIDQHTSFFGGVRLGWDLDENWGWEGRVGWASVDISNKQGLSQERTADLVVWDVSLVHYFASDLRIRPFVSVGVGAVDWEFVDAAGLQTDEKVVGVPISIGVKQRYDDWLVFRFDLTDNIAFGGGTVLGTQHNLSATASFEIRFGGPRTSYWPWQPRKYYSW